MRSLPILFAAVLISGGALAQEPTPSPTPSPMPTPAPVPTPVPTPAPTPAPGYKPPPPPVSSRWFFGGGVGASFGSVDYISIAPMVGYRVTPRFDVGLQPFYSYTKYDNPDFSANNYGADALARFTVFRNFFLEGRGEWISYEYQDLGGSDHRTSDFYPMAGAGYAIGRGKVGVYFSALYNFGYDDNDPFRPYDSPWIFSVGVGVGF
jgi:hypothetical protein